MTKRIFKAICFAAVLVFCSVSLVTLLGAYDYVSGAKLEELEEKIILISEGVDLNGAAYFEGKAEVQVPDYDQIVKANIEVVLANSVVAITTTERFRGYFPSFKFSVKGIEYNFESGDLLFMEAGNAEVVCEAVRQAHLESGKTTTIKKSVTLRPTTRHTLQFDLSTAGNLDIIEITFDDEFVETIEIEEELNDRA